MTDSLALPTRQVTIGPNMLQGILGLPAVAKGIVIFAHGSGSGRLSPRNNHVAARLREAGLATLLLDLLTPREEGDRQNVFNIALLAERLKLARDWTARTPETAHLQPCYFGASTGGGAAIRAAADDPRIAAIVSRGGRPDLAGPVALSHVKAPTMLIVGGNDGPVIDLNVKAQRAMRCESRLVVIPGAGHLFEEPGTLEQVVDHAKAWFQKHLGE